MAATVMAGRGLQMVEAPALQPRELERALGELQERIARANPQSPPCRILTVNLIARAPASAESAMREVVSRVLARHPCRAFLLFEDEGAEEMRVRLEAGLRRQDGVSQIVLELVSVWARPGHVDRQAALVRPRVVADLPVVLSWWAPVRGHEVEIRLLGRMATGVVFDSGEFEDPAADAVIVRRESHRPCRDLVEFRLRPWRRALAEAFERFEWDLRTPTRVVLRHGRSRAAWAAAWSLARWLEERLGAETKLAPEADEEDARQPRALELEHGDHQVSIERVEDRLRVVVTLPDRCLLPLWMAASRAGTGDLMAAAIDEL